jgi:hypothetical protein
LPFKLALATQKRRAEESAAVQLVDISDEVRLQRVLTAIGSGYVGVAKAAEAALSSREGTDGWPKTNKG